MNYCYYCHSLFFQSLSWSSFLGIESPALLCPNCSQKLEKIEGSRCDICSRAISEEQKRCIDCQKWEEQPEWKNILVRNYSIYHYNDFLKELISRFKFRGDAALAKVFAKPMKKIYQQYFPHHLIVPIPLSKRRLYERGFNQAELLAKQIGEPLLVLRRTLDEEKQSKKSRKERLDLLKKNTFVIEWIVNKKIENHDIIIIDDIYTTGVTIRQAAKVLIAYGAKSVSSLTLGR